MVWLFYTLVLYLFIFLQIDILKSKRKLLDLARLLTDNCIKGVPVDGPKLNRNQESNKELRGWPYFHDIFMVSALTGIF